MLDKIKEILEKRTVKSNLLTVSIIGFLFCFLSMLPQIQNFIIKFFETMVLRRKLENIGFWRNYIFSCGYNFAYFFVIVFYLLIRKKRFTSFCFLLAVLVLYICSYKFYAVNLGSYDRYRFPVFVVFLAFVIHIFANRHAFSELTNRISPLFIISGNVFNQTLFLFITGSLLGVIFFLNIFGTKVLDFTYTDWLMPGGDLTQQYLGWKLFRNSAWYFPLGLMDNVVYPFKVSIIYNDSIPLFAIVFKLFSPLLPENFQYLGLFGIICYALQSGISVLIIRKIGGNIVQSVSASIFFILSPVMMQRIFGHTPLTAHFILLLCILVCFHNKLGIKKQILIWSWLLALSATIHMYFVPMVMIFMFFYLLREYFLTKKIIGQCIVFGISIIVLIGTMYCFGAFYFVNTNGVSAYKDVLGYYSANLNTFVNSQGNSHFIKNLPLATNGQYEGYAYIGIGIIFFILIIIGYEINTKNLIKNSNMQKSGLFPYITGIVLSFLLFALSPTITFNQYMLFTYPVISRVEWLWGIFGCTGRMTWPIVYIIMTFCIWWAITRFSFRKATILLAILLLIQWYDLKPWFVNKGNRFKTITTWQTELASTVWDDLANDYDHIFFTGEYIKLNSFLDLAANHKMTVNDAYLARTNQIAIDENKQNEKVYFMNNGPRDDMVYVFQNEEQTLFFRDNARGMFFYLIDDVLFGINSGKTYLKGYEF